MRVVLASSEAVPYAKTGGLADVTSALAKALAGLGHDVSLVLPHYPQSVASAEVSIEPSGRTVNVAVGNKQVAAEVLKSQLPGTNVDVFHISQPEYFDRAGLYGANGEDYSDNCERFVFLSRAVLEVAREFDLQPDVVHANDWQTGLIPALLEIEYRRQPGFAHAISVFTIHNIAFQGNFWHWDMQLTGIDWNYFNWMHMEFHGQLSLLKTGMVFADMVTTVSPTYAREVQTEEFGYGMQDVLSANSGKLEGILNGIDPDVWNPATDALISQNYDSTTVDTGKAACKLDVQQRLGLPQRDGTPLVAMISRMTDQKGFDLIAQCADELPQLDLQFAFLGTGDRKYESMLTDLSQRHSDRIAAAIGFDESLAHQLEAGADIYLMPSRFEPCGLNQMYSLAYGTIPIVRPVGGLADSVTDASTDNLAAGTANGFTLPDYVADALIQQLRRSREVFGDNRLWSQLVQTGMNHDWSWKRSAQEYVNVYERALSNRQESSNFS